MDLPNEQWRFFVETGVWPKRTSFSPQDWIQNFREDEKPLALRLLDSFTYFSEDMVKQLFRSSFIKISKDVLSDKNNLGEAKREWKSFISSAYVVRVTGELPSDTDSGYLFARYSRDVLGISEANIISPENAIKIMSKNPIGNIVFVDDFVGSGNQFIETWNRRYSEGISFNELEKASDGKINFFYCPVICTERGGDAIKNNCSNVIVKPSHYYSPFHSALNGESFIWRDDMKSEGPEFIRVASERAGIPDLKGGEGCWRGFHGLGLALAFSHGWPDATLPLFYHDLNGWRPLLKKGVL